MKLLTSALKQRVQRDILPPLAAGRFLKAAESVERLLAVLYGSIPEKKRISYGRVYTIKILARELFDRIASTGGKPYTQASGLFAADQVSWQVRGTALGILSHCGCRDYVPVLPHFRSAAASQEWEFRELAQMFFRRLIKAHPDPMWSFLAGLSKARDPNLRRFVAETLRPVQENRWFYDDPDYPLSLLRRLFCESHAYPRTAVGNNLSDLARRLPQRVYALVEELVATGDRNAYWIATRACRNLVKKEPARVLDLLHTDVYRYKDRVYTREGRTH
jgi:3-methyladenine DNA glycosylase AlkC